MCKKLSILLTILVIFVHVMVPYCQTGNIYINKADTKRIVLEQKKQKIENVCSSSNINPRVISIVKNNTYKTSYVVEERKEILNEEFETIIVELKYRPQQARKNVTTDSTNIHS